MNMQLTKLPTYAKARIINETNNSKANRFQFLFNNTVLHKKYKYKNKK